MPILMQESFWWWQGGVRYGLLPSPPSGISVPISTSEFEDNSIFKQVLSNQKKPLHYMMKEEEAGAEHLMPRDSGYSVSLRCTPDNIYDLAACSWCSVWEGWEQWHWCRGTVNSVAVHPSGKLALTVGQDKSLRTWNLVDGRPAFVSNIKEGEALCWWPASDTCNIQSFCFIVLCQVKLNESKYGVNYVCQTPLTSQ